MSESSLSAGSNCALLAIQNEQADLNLRMAHISEGTFSDVVAHKLTLPFVFSFINELITANKTSKNGGSLYMFIPFSLFGKEF